MPLIETKGAASAQGFGLTLSSGAVTYIEDVFSTYLYTGNGSTQTITNGIDLSGKGGLVWTKKRNSASSSYHTLIDTLRGTGSWLRTDGDVAAISSSDTITSFNASGYALGTGASYGTTNTNSDTYVSWTFREQPKFFDVVTFTSSASGNKTFSHNLGAVPGCVIIKNTQTADPWIVYHRSVGDNAYLQLNSTAAQDPLTGAFSATSTTFTISSSLMYNSQNYVAYLFAHDAGGFGLTGTDNVISCGSYTGDGGTASTVINLGYEPQWILVKRTDASTPGGNWGIFDSMRGLCVEPTTANDAWLQPNTSVAESMTAALEPTATGFRTSNGSNYNASGGTYIYIAIRRGPMKTPTSGTSVYTTDTAGSTQPGVAPLYRSSFPVDLAWEKGVSAVVSWYWTPRLLSGTRLSSDNTDAEAASASRTFDYQNGWQNGTTTNSAYRSWMFRRYPGVLDVVCYTGDATSDRAITFSTLGVVPELIIIKDRTSGIRDWAVYNKTIGQADTIYLNTSGAVSSVGNFWGTTAFTSTTFRVGGYAAINASGDNYVAYLFATCAGVSKVGSYTGTGALQTINCGFTGGARFVLIKRTDSTGDWYVYDSARGISSGNDPYLLLNSTAAEVTGTNYVDTTSVGFQVTAAAPAGLNANGGTYIFLAIA